MKIKIPFNDWSKKRIFSQEKKATTRYKKYGNVGDIFEVEFGLWDEVRTYELDLVIKVPLWFVIEDLWRTEGAISSFELEQVWKDIHKKKGVLPFDMVWFHHFKEVT